MRAATLIIGILIWTLSFMPASAEERVAPSAFEATALYDALLADHVRDGAVDYSQLCQDARLSRYIDHIAGFDLTTIQSSNDLLAHYINAYNAYTLHVICENYPVESINDLHTGGLYIGTVLNKTIWDKEFVVINGEKMSLNHLEHDIIRKVFGDARIHFAVVCAAVSCPPLRSEAFVGARLDAQLDEQGRVFLAEAHKNRFDLSARRAYLSKILDWYADDFGGNDVEVLTFISRFLPDSVAGAIRENPGDWDVSYTDYDWALNDTASAPHTSD